MAITMCPDFATPPVCKNPSCGKYLTFAEAAAYRSVCEDCWAEALGCGSFYSPSAASRLRLTDRAPASELLEVF